jgi:hypothetical protein
MTTKWQMSQPPPLSTFNMTTTTQTHPTLHTSRPHIQTWTQHGTPILANQRRILRGSTQRGDATGYRDEVVEKVEGSVSLAFISVSGTSSDIFRLAFVYYRLAQ